MRITFVMATAGSSGGNRVIEIYAGHLARKGHRVLVIFPDRPALPLRRRIKSVLKGKGWSPPREHFQTMFNDGPYGTKLISPARPIVAADLPDADVVIATWWETAEWVARLPPQKGKKVYFVQHHETEFSPDGKNPRAEATYRLPLRKIAVARWLVDIMRTRYGDAETALVANGVDLEQFNAPERDKQRRLTIGFLYNSLRFKGSDIAIAALERARRQVPDLSVVAFGFSAPQPPHVLPPDTTFTIGPSQDRLRDLYGACDAWLFASRSEGYGLPLLEAMACRTPVIATPAGAAPELVGAGGGYLVRPEDPDDMARAIVRMNDLSNADWKALSARARAVAAAHPWAACADQFEAALEQAASTRPRRSSGPTLWTRLDVLGRLRI